MIDRDDLLDAIGMVNGEAVYDAWAFDDPGTPERRGRSLLRQGAMVLLAAILTAGLIGVCFAAIVNNWLVEFFTRKTDGGLQPDQYQFIEENYVGIGQSVTKDGYTVTVDSAICDAYSLYLVIRVQGPEGVRLEYPRGLEGVCFGQASCRTTGPEPWAGHIAGWSRGWETLDDGDGKENTVTFLCREDYIMAADDIGIFNDGKLWRLRLGDLYKQEGEFPFESTVIAEGGWSFEFSLMELDDEMELVASPVACLAQAGGENGDTETIPMQVDSFVLRPFSAVLAYSFLPGLRPEAVEPLYEVSLLMKDGSVVKAQFSAGGGAGAAGSNGGTMFYQFDAPVMLDQVAELLLPGANRIPISLYQ